MKNLKLYLGIFMISIATLSFELSLIRFFSISQWYHFAFMVVSISLFGMAVAGTFLAIKKLKKPLAWSSIGFSLSVLIGFFIVNNISFDPFKAGINYWYSLNLIVYYFFLGMPFFFFGIIIAHLLDKHKKISGKIYFWNMLGSSIGVLTGLFIVSYFNVYYVLAISFLGFVSLVFFSNFSKKSIVTFIGAAIILIIFGLFFSGLFEINMSEYKELNFALDVPDSEIIDTRYNSFSRIDIVNSSYIRHAPGLSPVFRGSLPKQIGLMVDGESIGAITYADLSSDNLEDLSFLEYLPEKIAFKVNEDDNVLVINSGTGLNVLNALYHERNATAIESNPLIVDVVKNKFSNFSGEIYSKANTKIGEGRNYIKANDDKYGIIILSLSGSLLGEASGISSLNENYLLTKEAFKDYYNSLSDDGVLIITRWLNFPPKESLRLFSLAWEIDPESKKTAMFRSWTTVSLIITKQDINAESATKIKEFSNNKGFDIIYLPYNYTPNINLKFQEPYYHDAIQNLLKNKTLFYSDYIFDITPTRDDKPFYFNFFKLSKFNELREMSDHWNPFLDSGFLAYFILLKMIVFSFALIILPLWLFNNKKIKKIPLGYFFFIGIGFMFVQIVLIQKFILYLGHVMYSSAAIIFSMLLFSSIGSFYSQKINPLKLKKITLTAGLMIIASIFVINAVMVIYSSLSFISRIIISIMLIAPLGFVLGMPFPLGIRLIENKSIPWAWAANGMASVLGPILAIISALFLGYNIVLMVGGVIYMSCNLWLLSIS